MIKRTFVLAAAMLVAGAATAEAQSGNCPAASATPGSPSNAASDVCRQAADIFQLLAPQLGLAMTGGNATLGRGGTLGGFPRFTVGIRGNVFSGDLPDIENFPAPRTSNNQVGRALPTTSQVVGLPAVDAAIGIFRGIPLVLTNVGGIDLLVSATYVPEIGAEGDDFVISPEGGLKLGFGARVGIIQESLLLPGVGFTILRRDLPVTTVSASTNDFDFRLEDLNVRTTAWRLVASKNILLFGLAAGFGQDSYRQSARISGSANDIQVAPNVFVSESFQPVDLVQNVTRSNMFADLSINLPVLKIIGEVGRVSGGALPAGRMVNNFGDVDVMKSRTYASVGVRIGF
jgi:hypothetical protein